MKRLLPLIFISAFFLACEDNDDDIINGNSSIGVTVLRDGQPVSSNISVITEPFTTEEKTDAFGQVVFKNLEAGTYTVFAFIPKHAAGKTAVKLTENQLENIDVDLVAGVFIEPLVNLSSPEHGQGFAQGEEIEFTASIKDNNTEVSDLTVKWASHHDGELSGGTVSPDGTATLRTSKLSKNEHYVKIVVTNKLGISSTDSVFINTLSPRSLNISVSQSGQYDNTLSWSTTTEVSKFEVYRYTRATSIPELLATVSNTSSTYFDNTAPFADSVFYFVKSYNSAGYSSKSNTVGVKGSPIFNIAAKQAEMLIDGSLIYLRAGSTIHVLNYETGTIETTKQFSGTIGYFHVGNNGSGNELYVPNSDGTLYIYDLATMELKASTSLGVPVNSIISNGTGLLFTSVTPSPWWENPLRVINRESLAVVGTSGDFDNTRIRLVPGTNRLIEITTTISPVDMDYYEFNADGAITLHKDDIYHGDHPLDPQKFKIAPAQDYLVTAAEGAIYTATSTMTFQSLIPRGADYFSDFEFNADGSLIYAAVATRKSITVYQYPSLNTARQISTRGYPLYIFRKGERLIVVSAPDPHDRWNAPSRIGVELHDLN